MAQPDVIVVGGGPTGMTLAGDLARAGRSVVVLERYPVRRSPGGVFATTAAVRELLDGRGLADGLPDSGVPQGDGEQLLSGYAEGQGVRVLRGVEVVGLIQDPDGVSLAV